nr:uncharacterized protein LOC113819443 [Penaeus vannamei]
MGRHRLMLAAFSSNPAPLSETRLSEEGSLTEVGKATFFWKGLPEGVQRNYGVAFAVKTSMLSSIPQSPIGVHERLMSWRIPLTDSRYATLISAYAPTLDAEEESKDRFYSQLHTLFQSIPHDDKIILLGDFNARVGRNHQLWQGIMGRHGTTWMHPRSKTWHILDYAIVRRKDLRDVVITRAMRGADGWTDHRLVRTTMKLCIQIVGTRLSDPNQPVFPPTQEGLNQNWDHVSNILLDSATSILGTTKRKHRDWFDEQAPDIHNLLEEKTKLTKQLLTTQMLQQATFAEARSKVQHMTRSMQNEWWLKLAGEIQGFADIGNQQEFYSAIKRAYGPQRTATCPIRSADGSKLITDKKEILDRWAEHYQHLLNRSNPSDPTVFENLPEFPTIPELDNMPHAKKCIWQ